MLELLKNAGADMVALDNSEMTPLDLLKVHILYKDPPPAAGVRVDSLRNSLLFTRPQPAEEPESRLFRGEEADAGAGGC